MKIVLDTNILVSAIKSTSPTRIILEQIFDGNISLYVSTEILLEYEEVIGRKYGKNVANNIIEAITNSSYVYSQEIYFKLRLITNDPDDDKFADCAFASGADWLVTNDRHFNLLKQTPFPSIKPIQAHSFVQLLQVLPPANPLHSTDELDIFLLGYLKDLDF